MQFLLSHISCFVKDRLARSVHILTSSVRLYQQIHQQEIYMHVYVCKYIQVNCVSLVNTINTHLNGAEMVGIVSHRLQPTLR